MEQNTNIKKRRPYRCSKCKQIKKGHICTAKISEPKPKKNKPKKNKPKVKKTRKKGAGDHEDHINQDSCELYFVYKFQKELENNNKHINLLSNTFYEDFKKYCTEKKMEHFINSKHIYKENIDKCIKDIVLKVIKHYPKKYMNVRNVETEFRNKGMKGDFIILYSDSQNMEISKNINNIPYISCCNNRLISPLCYKSISLKNYKTKGKTVQCSSSTFLSFLYSFFLTPIEGPGNFINPITGETFSPSKNKKLRDEIFDYLKLSNIKQLCSELDKDLNDIKKYYHSDEALYFNTAIKNRWKDDCKKYGVKTAQSIYNIFQNIDNDIIKSIMLKKIGLNKNGEDYIYIRTNIVYSSLFNNKINKLNDKDTTLTYNLSKSRKDIIFKFNNNKEVVLTIRVPFTLQKNGAWWIPKNKFEGRKIHPKENVPLRYCERRPKKSRELNTSTNCYVTWFI